MIEIIVADVDGCLSAGVGKPFDLDKFNRIQELNERSKAEEMIPALTVCSGRQQPYLEAMLQLINGYYPAIFENGGGLFDLQTLTVEWNSHFTQEKAKELQRMREMVETEYIDKYDLYLEVGKHTALGILGYDQDILRKVYRELRQIVVEREFELEVIFVHFAIDILVSGINKGTGVNMLSEKKNIPLTHIAAVGDSDGDSPLLNFSGFGFAPANASPKAKEAADYVSELNDIEAVMEIYEKCIQINREMPRRKH